MSGALMCYFGTNKPFLIYALCVILPTGYWGTPHYSQPATEERQHLTAIQGTWNTPNIENHLGGPGCVIFDHIIQSRCLSYRGDSQPASEEHPVTPNWPLRSESCMGRWGTLNIENHVWGPWWVISGQIILSWYMHNVWYSEPATEEHLITPNRPLRNGSIWLQYGSRKTGQTLKTISRA